MWFKSLVQLKYPISFRNDRDIRTLVELAALGSGLSIAQIKNSVNFIGDAHDALNDCKYQIEYMRMCLSFINIIKQEAI